MPTITPFWLDDWRERTDADVGLFSDLTIDRLKVQTPHLYLDWYSRRLHTSGWFAHQTMQLTDTFAAIRNILGQVKTTKIDIGHTKGYYISENQHRALLELLPESGRVQEEIPDGIWVSGTEDELRAQRHQLSQQIKDKEFAIKVCFKSEDKVKLNHDLGKLLSARAKLDKALAAYK